MKRKTNEKGRGVTSMKLNILSRITWPSYVLRGSLSLSFSLLFRLSRTSRKSCNDRGERFSKNSTPLIARYNRSAHLAERTVLPLRCGKKRLTQTRICRFLVRKVIESSHFLSSSAGLLRFFWRDTDPAACLCTRKNHASYYFTVFILIL